MYNKLKICKLIDSIGSQEKAAKDKIEEIAGRKIFNQE